MKFTFYKCPRLDHPNHRDYIKKDGSVLIIWESLGLTPCWRGFGTKEARQHSANHITNERVSGVLGALFLSG